jgi:hypothetical protein
VLNSKDRPQNLRERSSPRVKLYHKISEYESIDLQVLRLPFISSD